MKHKIIKIISVITLIPIIVKFIINRRKKSKLRKLVLEDSSNDYTNTAKNIANSIAKSRQLYKELIIKIHPDRFLDDRKVKATELSARITKAKRNFDDLSNLKIEVENFLNDNK